MSSASLAVHGAHPDKVRIAALSVAISLNLAALMLALRPLAPQALPVFETSPTPTVQIIDPPAPIQPPPLIVLKPIPRTVAIPHITTPIVPVAKPTPVTPSTVTEITTDPQPVSVQPTPTDVPHNPPAGGEVSLAYRSSPLRFPAQAVRMHAEGTVLLRVLVDENGRPLDVMIEHSSGYALLDRSAREQVLAGWQFQPAVVDGHAVRAWARVPVTFALQSM